MIKSESENVLKSVNYLSSPAALASIERDPYWPKWDSPWWHMLLLHEMGLTKDIPAVAIAKMVQVLKYHYLPIFPIQDEDMPEDCDPYRDAACFCAVGSMYQVLFAYGVNIDTELPWMRNWFLKYQLPDGGFNCDEAVYKKENGKGSIVSTLPCLEAILFSRNRDLTQPEINLLNKGAKFLIKHKLFRRISNGEVIYKDWLEIRFPRFYEYDFLRGYYFLAKWHKHSGFIIPDELVDDVEKLVNKQMVDGVLKLKRYNLFDKRSYNPGENETWTWGEASEFDLMKAVSFDGNNCNIITKNWNEVKPKNAIVAKSYTSAYNNPIKLNVGESVKIEKYETEGEWIGWVFCITNNGISGWVSEKRLKISDKIGVVIQNYDATELTAGVGEKLKIYYEEFGWCWCKNTQGIKGWIPTKNLVNSN